MKYSIRTRQFVTDVNSYTRWTTEFDNMDSMEKAVRCARAHFTLVSEYGKLDSDICETMIKICETWLSLDSDLRPDMLSYGWYQRFQVNIGIFE